MPTFFDYIPEEDLLYLRSQLKDLRVYWSVLVDFGEGVCAGLNIPLPKDLLPNEITTQNAQLIVLSLAILSGILLIYASLACIRAFQRLRALTTNSEQLRLPLHALMTVIAPTESRWPVYYRNTACRNSSGRGSLQLSLSHLWNDVLEGRIGFMHPAFNLSDLVEGRRSVRGWKVDLTVDSTWISACMLRVSMARLASVLPQRRIQLPQNMQSSLGSPHPNESNIFAEPTTSPEAILMLDDVPYSSLTAYIRTFQESLAPNTSAMIGFSALGNPSLPNSRFVMAALPFLPRKFIRSSSSNELPPSVRRTLTPVLTSLENITQLLSSGPQSLVVESVQNVSDQYARFLQDCAEELVDKSDVRDRFVKCWGMEGWREEVLVGQWEAALFSAGVLKRWLVVVKK